MAQMRLETKNELIGLEKKYWQALKDRDVQAALKLTADPCVVTGAQGVGVMTLQQMEEMSKSADYRLNSFEFVGEPDVISVTDDVAVVAYKVKEDLTVDGKPVKLEAAESSTWVKREGNWVCVLHNESISGDPFGRD
ncbi:MAG TPA: nuclear transport factor 2 family protein [Bdellovibrionales bacterium]|nr:nuclear transport factor 2 family protein [Bdellovibrionales bacterium]